MPEHCISATNPLLAPTAFRRVERDDSFLLVDPDFETAFRNLDFPNRLGDQMGGRAPATILDLPGHAERIHLRAVRHGGWLGGLWGTRVAGLGRCIRELEAAAQLRARGAPVPRPAVVWGRRLGPFWEAYLGTLYEEETQDGVSFLASNPSSLKIIEAARAAGRAIRNLHDANCRHADLHIGNLLFRTTNQQCEVTVVDLDRARVDLAPPPARRMFELMRLYRSLKKRGLLNQVDHSARDAFFDDYIHGDEALAQALMRYRRREKFRIRLHSLAWSRTPGTKDRFDPVE